MHPDTNPTIPQFASTHCSYKTLAQLQTRHNSLYCGMWYGCCPCGITMVSSIAIFSYELLMRRDPHFVANPIK